MFLPTSARRMSLPRLPKAAYLRPPWSPELMRVFRIADGLNTMTRRGEIGTVLPRARGSHPKNPRDFLHQAKRCLGARAAFFTSPPLRRRVLSPWHAAP